LNFEHIAHRKKVKEWFLSPLKFCKEIENEQAKYIGKCLYHLTKSHQTCDCFVKKECDRLLATKKASTSSNSMTSPTGQLRHITEETFEDAVDDSLENCTDELGNDTNDESLHDIAQVSNHYLCLVKSSHTLDARHMMKFSIIIDSGANYHMFRELQFFDTLIPATGKVLLGDGITSLPIRGIGTVKLNIDRHILLV